MKLYYRADCPFCWKVRIFLHESGVNLQEISVELGIKHPDVISLNPRATVPIFVEGDLVLCESAVIIEYLADKYPESHLMAELPAQRAKVRQIHSYSDNNVGKTLFPYIKQVRESEGHTATDELQQTTSVAWNAVQELLSEQLGNRDFFGPRFSIAECALLPRFSLALVYGLPINDDFQNLKEWYRRCITRPSFAATFPKFFPGIDEMIKLESLMVLGFNRIVKSGGCM